MHHLLKSFTVLTTGAAFGAATAFAAPAPDLPGDLKTGELLYESSMAEAESVEGWRMEGPGETEFKDGWMHMQSPGEEGHHVFWCPDRFPESFVAQWEAQNLETDAGLCIVFFAASGLDGQGIFHEDLPERDGTFTQYTKGKIRCYHASYYANAAHNPDRQQTNLRKNPGFHLVGEGPEGIPTKSEKAHTVTLAKQGPRIRLWVDDKTAIDWTDKGKQGGDPHGDGFIGLRQMQWTHFRYRNFRVWGLPENDHASAKDEGEVADWIHAAPARYAEFMLEHGRGRWADTPLFASMLERGGDHPLLTEAEAPDLSDYNIRSHDRAYGASNVAHDEGLYHLLYSLSEETGEARYAEAADETLAWFMKNSRSKKTNLLAWGEHLSWDLRRNAPFFPKQRGRRITFFELYGAWGLWDRLFDLAPQAGVAFAEGMWDHAITDHEKILFSRHVKYDKGADSTGWEFPRYYGHFPLIWAHAMQRTDDEQVAEKLREATARVLDTALARRHPKTNAVPSGTDKRRRLHKTYWLTNNLMMAGELHRAMPMLTDDLAAKARELIDSADDVALKLDHELGPDGRGFVSRAHVDTLEPGDARSGVNRNSRSTLWKAGYGMPLTSGIANQMLERFEQSGKDRYRELGLAGARHYLESDPDTSVNLHPSTLVEAINLMRRAHDLTGERVFLERAVHFAGAARELFFDESSPLPRVLARDHDHYESITGGPALMLSLHKLSVAIKQQSHN